MNKVNDITVGIIIHAINSTEFFAECIQSILNQSYSVKKIIICHDSSAKNNQDIINQYAKKYSKLIDCVFLSEKSSKAKIINTALEKIQEDYFSIISVGDFWHKDKLKHEIETIYKEGTNIAYSGSVNIDNNDKNRNDSTEKYTGREGNILFEILTRKIIFRSPLIKTDCLSSIGNLNESLGFFEDFDFNIRIAQKELIAFVPEETVFFRNDIKLHQHIKARKYLKTLNRIYGKYISIINKFSKKQRLEVLSKKYHDCINYTHQLINSEKLLKSKYYRLNLLLIKFRYRKMHFLNKHNLFLKGKPNFKYIFCINSGRAGSQYLSEILNSSPKVSAYHEPIPQMIGTYLDMVTHREYKKSFKERQIKVKRILCTLDEFKYEKKFKGKEIYAETSHMFIKTFFDVVIKHFKKEIAVIYLKRNFLDTLTSFQKLRYFTNDTPQSFDWMISPNAKTAAVKAIAPDTELDSIDLSIAYLIDIQARYERFKKKYPRIPVYEISLEELNSFPHVKNLFNNLNIEFSQKTKNLIGTKINERNQAKQKAKQEIDREYLKKRIIEYKNKLRSKNIQLPKNNNLEEYI
jgi:glycosyltransferase involved in cell wall biosynthesis